MRMQGASSVTEIAVIGSPSSSLAVNIPPRNRPLHGLRRSLADYMHTFTLCTLFVSIGGFLFGFDTGSIGPITVMPQFREHFAPITPTIHGLIVSCILLTASSASLLAGPLSDRLSRTYTISLGASIFAAGSAFAAGASSRAQLFAGRCIAGAGEGLFLSTITVYTCEIAPAPIRGTLACTTQLFNTIGIASGYFVCYGTVKFQGSASWRFPLGMQAVVATVLAVGAPWLPHSPRWLRHVGRHADAARAWDRLGLIPAEAEKEDNSQDRAERSVSESIHKSWWEQFKLLWRADVRRRTSLGCFLMAMQQLSGIDGVLYYAPVLFTQAGLTSTKAAFLASGVSGLINVLCTILSQPFTDKWGRRPSLILGGSAIGSTMLTIGIIYATHAERSPAGRWAVIVLLYVFLIVFTVSWAISTRIYASEIQPMRTRAAATSLAQSACWITNWVIAFTTPLFLSKSHSGPYFLFGGCSLFTVIICVAFQPESKGVSLENLDDIFKTSPWREMVDEFRRERHRLASDIEDIELVRV